VYNITSENCRNYNVQDNQTFILIIAMQNTDWDASYCPFIGPQQQTTVAENSLLRSGESTGEATNANGRTQRCMPLQPYYVNLTDKAWSQI